MSEAVVIVVVVGRGGGGGFGHCLKIRKETWHRVWSWGRMVAGTVAGGGGGGSDRSLDGGCDGFRR